MAHARQSIRERLRFIYKRSSPYVGPDEYRNAGQGRSGCAANEVSRIMVSMKL